MRLLIVCLAVSILTGCQKKYSCTCTSDLNNEIVEVSIYDLSASDAQKACANRDAEQGISCVLDEK